MCTAQNIGEVGARRGSPVDELADDAADDRLYGMLSKRRLIRIDPATGQASFVGLLTGFFGIDGLAWPNVCCRSPVVLRQVVEQIGIHVVANAKCKDTGVIGHGTGNRI